MFREMRKSTRALSEAEAYEILKNGEYGILSTQNEDGYSYGVPLSYALEGNNLYFHGAREGQKLDNIKINPKVCFTVVGATEVIPDKFSTKYESSIAFGKAEIIDGAEKSNALKLFIEKYSPQFKDAGMEYINKASSVTTIIKLTIEHLTGKASR